VVFYHCVVFYAGMPQSALMPLRDMSSGMHPLTATPASITDRTRCVSMAYTPAWPGGATTPNGRSIPGGTPSS